MMDDVIDYDDVPEDPMRAVIYGPPGMGKTSLAASFPNTIFLRTEDGRVRGAKMKAFPLIDRFAMLQRRLSELYNDEHPYRTLALDTLDGLEPIVWAELCRREGWSSIEAPGYGKGYQEADAVWSEVLQALYMLRRDKGMTILLLAHSDVHTFNDPRSTSYSQYDFRLHKRAHAIIEDHVDCIFFLNQDVNIIEEKQGFNKTRTRADGMSIYIHANRRPAFNAKNRYEIPDKLLYERGAGYRMLAPYLPKMVNDIADAA